MAIYTRKGGSVTILLAVTKLLISLAVMVKIFSLSKTKENMTFKKSHFDSKYGPF